VTPPRFVRRYAPIALVIAGVAGIGAACSSSSTATTAPTSLKCQVALNTTSALDANGGSGTVTVTTQPECAWTASTPSSWISDLSPTSGQGNGQVTFRATANLQSSARDGEIVVNDERARVTQQGSPCRFELTPASREVSSGGGSGTFDVVAPAGCSWTTTTTAPWISITAGASGSGNGAVSYGVQANSGAPRSGRITLGNQAFLINQESGVSSCTYNLSSITVAVPAGGSPGSVNVTAGESCTWTATSNAAWITVTGVTSGTGNGAVSYGVQANTGTARAGTISIAGKTFTVNQADGTPSCTYQLSATSTSVSAAATSGSVNVTAGSGCAWSAVSNASWITVTGGASGSGIGTVTFSVAVNNTGAQRSGTITIEGQTYAIEQAVQVPTCNYQLNPTSVSSPIAAGGGSGSFNVIAGTSCGWTATTGEPWITFPSGTTGSGNGPVAFAVAANPTTSARSGGITVQGQTFTVTQAAAAPSCTYQLSSTSVPSPIAAGGGSGSFNVIAGTGCGWTATTAAPWITFPSGTTGSGNGPVAFTVAANPTTSTRSGAISVQGQTFTVTQAAAVPACTYSLSSSSASVNRNGNPTPSFMVKTGAGCSWTATSNASWITVNPRSGTGTGTVTLDVSVNLLRDRSGTVTVEGQTFTVNQDGLLDEGIL
jgi:hypothetical protein